MKVAAMLKFIRKQLARFWKPKNEPKPPEVQHYEPECTHVPQVSACEYQQLSEPHLMPPPVKPEHPAAIKHECRVEDSLGQGLGSQDPGAETLHQVQQQLWKVAARGAEVLRRLGDAEDALAGRVQKQSSDRLLLTRLGEENARLVAQVNTQERMWKKKFRDLVSLSKVLQREKEWEELELKRQALKTMILSLEKHHRTQNRTPLIKKVSRRCTNHRHKQA